jgi:hypothetical protein
MEPIARKVTRYTCPFCRRTRSSKATIRKHMESCWWNPEAKGCKTCANFREDASEPEVGAIDPEHCTAGVVFPGLTLLVHCEKWEAAS